MAWLRRVLAMAIAVALLAAANFAVRECPAGAGFVDNCLWLGFRGRLGLPASTLLRAAFLEVIGLSILASLLLTFSSIWPRRKRRRQEAPRGSAPAGT
jgi:hypothetical protein